MRPPFPISRARVRQAKGQLPTAALSVLAAAAMLTGCGEAASRPPSPTQPSSLSAKAPSQSPAATSTPSAPAPAATHVSTTPTGTGPANRPAPPATQTHTTPLPAPAPASPTSTTRAKPGLLGAFSKICGRPHTRKQAQALANICKEIKQS